VGAASPGRTSGPEPRTRLRLGLRLRPEPRTASFPVLLASLGVLGGSSSGSQRLTPNAQRPTPNPDFNTDVRPVLAKHCFKCHGPDDGQRQAGLRLDVREAALAARPSGRRAVVPGK